MKKIIAIALVLVMALGIFAGCQPAKPAEAKTYTYKSYTTALGNNWNPHTWETNADNSILSYIETPLADMTIKNSETGEYQWIFVAAEDIKDVTKDNQADLTKFGCEQTEAEAGFVYEIKLRPEMKWQDGTPINADTYIYSMQMLLDPKLMNYRATDYYDGDLAIAGANNYAHSGRTIKKANSSDGETMAYALDALVKGEDGFYKTPDGAVVYIGLDDAGYGWMGGNTLTDYAGYFPEGVYDKLKGMADENGYVKVNDEALDTLYQFTGSEVWGNEPREKLGYYLSYDYTYANYTFDTVGCLKTGEYEITLVLEKSLSGFYLLYNLSGVTNNLVKIALYDACLSMSEGAGGEEVWSSVYNTNLATVEIPSTVESIGDNAFALCRSLDNVTIPKSVDTFGNYCFAGCATLSNFVFEETTAYQVMGTHFFYNCPNITQIILPSRPKMTDADAEDCANGESLTYSAGAIPSYTDSTQVPWSKYISRVKNVSISDGITGIGACVFQNYENLKDVHIGDSVQNIDLDTFIADVDAWTFNE